MKRNEIIELNGEEYTLELNRESAVKIEQRTNMQNSIKKLYEGSVDYIDEIDEEENPFSEEINFDEIIEKAEEKEKIMQKIICVAFYIWLYPNHKLKYNEVVELLKPYFEDEDKLEYISEKYGEYMKLSSEISGKYIEERKNLKAQTNKKN